MADMMIADAGQASQVRIPTYHVRIGDRSESLLCGAPGDALSQPRSRQETKLFQPQSTESLIRVGNTDHEAHQQQHFVWYHYYDYSNQDGYYYRVALYGIGATSLAHPTRHFSPCSLSAEI